jgi:transmembrane sensor
MGLATITQFRELGVPDATLADAVAEFNRYNQKKIVLAPGAPTHLTMVGTFPINDVELFGRVATLILKVHVANQGDKIVISR